MTQPQIDNASGRARSLDHRPSPGEATQSGARARERRSYRCQSKLCCPKFQSRDGRCPMCHREGVKL